MKVKTSELTGAALDWAVAFATESQFREGRHINTVRDVRSEDGPWWIEIENAPGAGFFHRFAPSTDWAQGGPIIERQFIQLVPGKTRWFANNGTTGETPLIAAMRCYVASKLGNEVDVPEELLA